MYVCTPNFHVRLNWIFNQFSESHWKTFLLKQHDGKISFTTYQFTNFEMEKERNHGQQSFIHCDVACPSAPAAFLILEGFFDKVDKSFQNKRPQNQIRVT